MSDEPFVERAGAWAAGLRYRDVPPAVRRAAKAQLCSTVGAAVWTLDHPVGARVGAVVEREFGDGSGATFLPRGDASPRAALYGNAALSLALDFDDTVLGGHTGHSAALAALAYGEAEGVGGKDALTAVVAANEVAARLGSAAAIGPFRGQQTAYVHLAGAAVARGVVEGLDADDLADALALALGQPPWPLIPAFLGSDAKVTSAAEPALTGATAVTEAREGSRGNRDVVEGEDGFLDEFADHPLPEFLGGLGERWHTRAVTVKPYPGCAYVTAPVHAALEVHRDLNDRGTVTVSSVTVEGSLFSTEVNSLAGRYVDGPDSPLSALSFSIPYNVAVALREGEHTPAKLRGDTLRDDRVWTLADRVSVEHDPGFTMRALRSAVPLGAMLRRVGPAVIPYAAKTVGIGATLKNLPTLLRFVRKRPLPDDLSGADKSVGARVTVRLADGETVSAECEHPPGFAGWPLAESRAIARKKLRRALEARGVGERDAERATDRLLSLDEQAETDLSELGELVASA